MWGRLELEAKWLVRVRARIDQRGRAASSHWMCLVAFMTESNSSGQLDCGLCLMCCSVGDGRDVRQVKEDINWDIDYSSKDATRVSSSLVLREILPHKEQNARNRPKHSGKWGEIEQSR